MYIIVQILTTEFVRNANNVVAQVGE